jgi:hypothetical protein
MPDELITTIGWLEPLLPDAFPEALLNKADQLRFAAGQLSGALSPETAQRVSELLQITNSYYSNLIEGQYTEPADMESASPRRAPKRPTKQLQDLAVVHVRVQAAVDRLTVQLPWPEGFSPKLLSLVHRHLFRGASPDDLKLSEDRRRYSARRGARPAGARHDAAKRLQDVLGTGGATGNRPA